MHYLVVGFVFITLVKDNHITLKSIDVIGILLVSLCAAKFIRPETILLLFKIIK